MPDPTFIESATARIRKTTDYLEVAFKPADSTLPVFVRVPLLTDLGGFRPNTNTVRKQTFVDANGQTPTLVAIINEGGNIQFSTAGNSKDSTFVGLLKSSKSGNPVLYKAHYGDITVQGQAKVADGGRQGGAQDIPDWQFTLEAETASYVDAEGNLIA